MYALGIVQLPDDVNETNFTKYYRKYLRKLKKDHRFIKSFLLYKTEYLIRKKLKIKNAKVKAYTVYPLPPDEVMEKEMRIQVKIEIEDTFENLMSIFKR